MDIFRKHEQFEMLVLDELNSARILPGLIFGGGTMLRLCHGLDRYSVDLDFYLIKSDYAGGLLEKCVNALGNRYVITDQADKRNTVLIELSSEQYPRRLKIEINKTSAIRTWKKEIAWSPYSTVQVLVNAVTLAEFAQMKTEALIDRKEIRDAYDLEFLLKKKITIAGDTGLFKKMVKVIDGFGRHDYAVKLGSVIEQEKRQYYIDNQFRILMDYLVARAKT